MKIFVHQQFLQFCYLSQKFAYFTFSITIEPFCGRQVLFRRPCQWLCEGWPAECEASQTALLVIAALPIVTLSVLPSKL